jgi:hypothetical protein
MMGESKSAVTDVPVPYCASRHEDVLGGGGGGRAGHILECGIGLGEWQEGSNNHRPQILLCHFFYDRMTMHRNRFLVNKTNRCTEFQFYWYYHSICFGQPFCPSSGVLSCTSALVHLMQL